MTLTPAQRAVAAAHLFLAAAALAGVTPVPAGVQYRACGIVEGLFALLLAHVMVLRGAWAAPRGAPGWTALAYGTVATAQVAEFLFPPPGMIEWVVVAALAFSAWSVLARGTRRRLVFALASLALLLAVVKFSMIPAFWKIGPEAGSGLGLGDAAESVRRAFAEQEPASPAAQLFGFMAVACWVLATRLLWPERPPKRRWRRKVAEAPAEGN